MTETERRSTKQRAAVEQVLRETDDFVSAQALHARMRADGSTVGLATVYRALNAMVEDERVDMLRIDDGEARYRLCTSDEHHHHLVCRECGRTVEVEGPAVESWADAVAREHGFRDVSHTLEVFGTCDRH
ncbi:Fur family transcriptional regulator [Arsenicicoccus dermatophilus]|uniref:Fur family transcriptional regulator n=1 Tax=Arsenicicoccus dermatophilus TaxID=1076331 RepID=UPI001F4D1051|nr:transcriptional repressor [Arsenicicoccus dermatophilus]MCH8613961.1 transcriptional repressor [Arsenicicoccus dermatophilus]